MATLPPWASTTETILDLAVGIADEPTPVGVCGSKPAVAVRPAACGERGDQRVFEHETWIDGSGGFATANPSAAIGKMRINAGCGVIHARLLHLQHLRRRSGEGERLQQKAVHGGELIRRQNPKPQNLLRDHRQQDVRWVVGVVVDAVGGDAGLVRRRRSVRRCSGCGRSAGSCSTRSRAGSGARPEHLRRRPAGRSRSS